jgi:putative ABC transport system permease protein
MNPLDRKLLRDLGAIKGQVAAVALVMACGLAMMILSRSLILSLSQKRDLYYAAHRMGNIFTDLRRAPKSVVQRITDLPGVAAVEARIKGTLLLDLPGVVEPADGLVLSLPDERDPVLMKLFLRQGRLPASGTRGEVAISEAFAEARGLHPGDFLEATLRGKKQRLRITGIALSPEFVFEARPGETLPDPNRFGVFWMRERELAAAMDLDGAFNNIVVSTGPGIEPEAIQADLDFLLARYGGLGAFGLREHPSASRLNDELGILSTLAIAFPLAFLSVAAFMSSAVLTRLVRLQREQIAQLKAFGFTSREIGLHYGKFALIMVLLGTTLGAAGGLHLGSEFVLLYHKFFKFPELPFQADWTAIGIAFSASAIAAFTGVWGAVLQAIRLSPAQAMRPEPPASFRASLTERLGFAKALPLPVRMALRNIERRPAQAIFTTLGLALAAGIPVLPGAMRDGVDHLLSFEWDVAQRQNASVSLREPSSARASHALAQLPSVLKSEAFRAVPVRIRFGHHTRRLLLTGLDPNGSLNRPLDQTGEPVGVPPSGMAISAKLAEILQAAPGDVLQVEILEGNRSTHAVKLQSLVTDYAGLNAYMGIEAVHVLLQEAETVSGAHFQVDTLLWERLFQKIKNTPAISVLRLKEATRASFKQTTAESINLLQTLYFSFAVVVAFGVVYNSARIALSERSRDLATLRVLGFTHREVAAVLIGELALLTLLAIPAGLAFGSLLSSLIISKVHTESVRLPLVLTSNNFAMAATIVLVSAGVSFALVTRRIRQLDLLAVLKAAE